MKADKTLLARVGAGPLEDLVCEHGEVLLDQIVATTRQHPLLTRAMTTVWMNSEVPAPVRLSLAVFGARDFVAEAAMIPAELSRYVDDRVARGWTERA